ncbi:hypothetical protein EON80_25165, partial [bacterium]
MSIPIQDQARPVGNHRKVMEAIAKTRDWQDKMRDVAQRGDGYHPWAIFEQSINNAEQFDFWFAKLPEDLTDADLSPLYLLAANAAQERQLRQREGAWEPDPNNPGTEYNGPIGEDHRPDRYNAEKWARAVVAKEEAHRDRFGEDLRLMNRGDVPERLKAAALALVALATEPEQHEDGSDEWENCAQAVDIVASNAAIRL